MDSRVDLDIVGVVENTDKSSTVQLSWDYLRHYERLFEEFRHQPIHIVEIGVFGGASLRMWKWFFSKAQLTGIDINPVCLKHAEERVRIEIGSQDDPELLDRVCIPNSPSIVIDDGSHTSEHRIATFQHVFPLLAPGGLYVVEDFAVHVGSRVAEAELDKPNGGEYFIDVARRCFAGGRTSIVRDIPQTVTQLVDDVVFFAGAVALRKKDPQRDVERALTTAKAYLGDAKQAPKVSENLARYVVQHNGSLDRAKSLLQSAIDSHGVSMSRLVVAAEIAMAAHDQDGARQAIAEACMQKPGGLGILLRLAKLQEDTGDLEGAIRTIEGAAARSPQLGLPKRALKTLLAKRQEAR